jgi:hypothetical protein
MRRHVREKSRGGELKNTEAQYWEVRLPPCPSQGGQPPAYFLPEWSPVRNLTPTWGLREGKRQAEPSWSAPSRREELVS